MDIQPQPGQPGGSVIVVNRCDPLPPYNALRRQFVVPIHRPHPLGNPFTVTRYGRNAAIAYYRRWLWQEIRQQGPALGALQTIVAQLHQGDVLLVCCCTPLPCHGAIVAAAVRWLQSTTRTGGTR